MMLKELTCYNILLTDEVEAGYERLMGTQRQLSTDNWHKLFLMVLGPTAGAFRCMA